MHDAVTLEVPNKELGATERECRCDVVHGWKMAAWSGDSDVNS